MTELLAVNLNAGVVLTTTGEVAPIDTMLADDGLETDDPNEACALIVPLKDGTWLGVDLSMFEPATIQ